MPSNDPLEQGNILLGGGSATMWGIKYLPGGQFSVEDSGGFHSIGIFAIGQSSHFDLDLHLGSGTYQLSVNNVGLLSGGLAANGAFDLTYFRSNGRTGFELPDMAFDNFRVVAVPEPSALALAGEASVLSSVLFLAVRLRKKAKPADIETKAA
jgi:hypothetical protein